MECEIKRKYSGLEYNSTEQLQKQFPSQTPNVDNTAGHDNEGDTDRKNDDSTFRGHDENTSCDYTSGEEDEQEELKENKREGKKDSKTHVDNVKAMMVQPECKGIEISLKNFHLRDVSSLYFEKLRLSIECVRCKGTSNFTSSCGSMRMIKCGKCTHEQTVTFRPAICHHFTSVIGYLDLKGCRPFDLILQNCSAVISCLNCSEENKLKAIVPGKLQTQSCRTCHQKLRIAADGACFTQLAPAVVQSQRGQVKDVAPSCKRTCEDQTIQEGKPLPNSGTCKHNNQSHCWLRFQCCGQCYPCDVCHNSKEHHAIKPANRIICGYCCKEQIFAAKKPCSGCGKNMTKACSSHWEGGQGNKDQTTMGRNDNKKYSNTNKTVSKRAKKREMRI